MGKPSDSDADGEENVCAFETDSGGVGNFALTAFCPSIEKRSRSAERDRFVRIDQPNQPRQSHECRDATQS